MTIVDLLDIGDFLTEEIKGPAQFTCKTGQGCQFEEPAMNQLINDIFGDNAITLKCDGGECLHYTQVPGYVVSILSLARPHPRRNLNGPACSASRTPR